MKIRTLIAAFSLIVAVPVMQAADSAAVSAQVAAQIKANPDNAAQIVADAIKADPALAPDIAAAAVKAAPGQAKAITSAAIKAAPDQILAIAKAESKAVPAQGSNIFNAAVAEAAAGLKNGTPVSTYVAQIGTLMAIHSQSLTDVRGGSSSSSGSDTELGEKVSATVSSPAT